MEESLPTSVIGLCLFTVVMIIAYRYASGKWQVKEGKRTAYNEWVDTKGKTARKTIVILYLLFVILMSFQILDQV